MPNYRYRCANGHEHEALKPMTVKETPCPLCGAEAQRQAVYRMAQSHKAPEDFQSVWHSSSVQAAHEEAKGYAQEVRAIAAEEKANGFPMERN